MYNGWTESPAQIARRKARILKGYKPTKRIPRPAAAEKSGGRKLSHGR